MQKEHKKAGRAVRTLPGIDRARQGQTGVYQYGTNEETDPINGSFLLLSSWPPTLLRTQPGCSLADPLCWESLRYLGMISGLPTPGSQMDKTQSLMELLGPVGGDGPNK